MSLYRQADDEAAGYGAVTSSTTRRFCDRPPSVELSATGLSLPLPCAATRSDTIPDAINALATESARARDSVWLAVALPVLSVYPIRVTVALGFARRIAAMCLMRSRDCGASEDEPLLNVT